MNQTRPALWVGDRVSFDGDEHVVVGLAGTSVRLRADSGTDQVVLAGHLMAAADFADRHLQRVQAIRRDLPRSGCRRRGDRLAALATTRRRGRGPATAVRRRDRPSSRPA